MDITKLFCEKTPFRLAKQGEYGQEYSFDYSTWLAEFGAGTLTWAFQGPSDSAARVLESTEDDGVSTIVLTADETASAGSGSMEVFFVDNGETQKRISATIQFYIEPSLVIGGSGGGGGGGEDLATITVINDFSQVGEEELTYLYAWVYYLPSWRSIVDSSIYYDQPAMYALIDTQSPSQTITVPINSYVRFDIEFRGHDGDDNPSTFVNNTAAAILEGAIEHVEEGDWAGNYKVTGDCTMTIQWMFPD